MEDGSAVDKDDEGFADCDSPEDETMETNLAAEGEGIDILALINMSTISDKEGRITGVCEI